MFDLVGSDLGAVVISRKGAKSPTTNSVSVEHVLRVYRHNCIHHFRGIDYQLDSRSFCHLFVYS